MNRLSLVLASAAVLALAGCASTPPASTTASVTPHNPLPTAGSSTVSSAVANLSAASGSLVSGKLTLMAMGDGVHISGQIGGLAPNSAHGFHIHETGDCSAADASSAGGHFNPAHAQHGRASAPMHHAGDIDNIVANTQGVATVDAHVMGVTLGGGGPTDILGRAIVVHQSPDDYTSQPAGNSGARVACGVIKAG